jgi:hypothetical protein
VPEARIIRATAVLASALVRSALALTVAVPCGYGGPDGGGGEEWPWKKSRRLS